jgi:peptidoglycan/xylan/chitin deacetylase (PgdA/CDA1 family)
MTKSFLLISLLTSFCALAQVAPTPEAVVAPPLVVPEVPGVPEIPKVPEVPDDGVRVTVLGYHDLAENQPETAMRIHTSKFRTQMQSIQQLGIKVITMEEFIAWKVDGKPLPPKCILITFDDGWKSVYTDAFPILKEMGFPFTIFLYKNYVDGGGKALTSLMIQEMLSTGKMSIGSHSVSHPYPVTVKSSRKKGPSIFDSYLRNEMGESKNFLESKFPVKVGTYAYPGGFFTEEMFVLGKEFGYSCLFTVLPGKINRSLPNEKLPRYIILGNYDKIFEMATTYREGTPDSAPGGTLPGLVQTTPFPVSPEAGAIINSRLPEISADLSKVENIDPKSLSMKVSGFGEVPANFAVETKKFSWQVNRRLRQPTCQVSITWKNTAGKAQEVPLHWTFQLDREAAYLPDGD